MSSYDVVQMKAIWDDYVDGKMTYETFLRLMSPEPALFNKAEYIVDVELKLKKMGIGD